MLAYDPVTGEAYGYAYMDIEYNTNYYYDSRLEGRLKNASGSTLDYEYMTGIMYTYELLVNLSSTNTQPGSTYKIEGKYRVDARYQDNYFYWDFWNFSCYPPLNIYAPNTYAFEGPGPETEIPTRFLWIGQTYSQESSACRCTCTTPVPYAEFTPLRGLFPYLQRCHMCKLGNATPFTGPPPYYNCLAWTLNDTTRWRDLTEAGLNGDNLVSVNELLSFYSQRGISNGGRGTNCQATSKLGQLLLTAHMLSELECGNAYGNIVGGN